MFVKNILNFKRLDGIRRSPVMAHLDETVSGAASIRAYGKQDDFIARNNKLIDDSQMPWYHCNVALR